MMSILPLVSDGISVEKVNVDRHVLILRDCLRKVDDRTLDAVRLRVQEGEGDTRGGRASLVGLGVKRKRDRRRKADRNQGLDRIPNH